MKKKMYLLTLCLSAGIVTFGQSVKIYGNIPEGINEVILKSFNDKSLTYEIVGVAKNEKGKYQFLTTDLAPNLLILDFDGQQKVRLSLTSERTIEVNLRKDEIEIKGSPESTAMLSFQEECDEIQSRHFSQLKIDADAAMASGDPAEMEKIQERSAIAIQEFLPELRNWIIDKGEGPAGYYALQFSDFSKELEFIETRLNAFQKINPNSSVTKALAREVYRSKVVAIGKTPPAIIGVDRDGKSFSLDQYYGKVLLIDFWAAWCRACRIENPQLVKVYQKYQQKGFEAVSISQDQTIEAWTKAIAKDGVGVWRHIWDEDETISALYSVSSLPQNIVVGADGKIIAKNVNAEQLESILRESF